MKKHAGYDILFYLVIPLIIWNYGRDLMGDYYAILLSTFPGFLYTVYRFIEQRQINITGMFVITTLLISTMVDILSPDAKAMLWNQVYLGYAFAGVFLFSMLIKKPLALYLAVDFAYLQGYERKNSLNLFKKKEIFKLYQLLTALFVIRGIFQSYFKSWLLQAYGVDGYGQMLIYLKLSGWIFGGLIVAGFFYTGHKINLYVKQHIQMGKGKEA
ncbi:VC0807 family protein [Piscibacillus salipiscarius]|uniref:VC0807 family protein n=1 Tax=Piscibacillus salipiscarius TaxID=299480 RepID=A0ABW5Q7Q0_9BACI